jgi:hypothetical protein
MSRGARAPTNRRQRQINPNALYSELPHTDSADRIAGAPVRQMCKNPPRGALSGLDDAAIRILLWYPFAGFQFGASRIV